MEAEKIFTLTVVVMINALFFSAPPFFIYAFIKYPLFRAWVVESIEDGDKVAHTKDAKNAVIIFFAFVIGWININVIFGMMLFDKSWFELLGSVTGLFFLLLGISKYNHSHSK